MHVSVTDAIDCTGTVNGIDPMAIVTLSGDQFIPGTTTFRHLEVTEVLEVCHRFSFAFHFRIIEINLNLSYVER